MPTVIRKWGEGAARSPISPIHVSRVGFILINVQINIYFVPKHIIFPEYHNEQNLIGLWLRGARDLEQTGLTTKPPISPPMAVGTELGTPHLGREEPG